MSRFEMLKRKVSCCTGCVIHYIQYSIRSSFTEAVRIFLLLKDENLQQETLGFMENPRFQRPEVRITIDYREVKTMHQWTIRK